METIETERLSLRRLEAADALAVLCIAGDEDTAWWADIVPLEDIDDSKYFIRWGNNRDGFEQYGITLRGENRVIGLVQVTSWTLGGRTECVMGYMLSDRERGRGYMTEAVRAVCGDLFGRRGVSAVTCEILPDNVGSRGVVSRCGFRVEDEYPFGRPSRNLDDRPLDEWVLTDTMWNSRAAA